MEDGKIGSPGRCLRLGMSSSATLCPWAASALSWAKLAYRLQRLSALVAGRQRSCLLERLSGAPSEHAHLSFSGCRPLVGLQPAPALAPPALKFYSAASPQL